jgi:tetratricopeptide (TPR) repeat protein
MSASQERRRTGRLTAITALAAVLAFAPAAAAPRPVEAIEAARALEREGRIHEAEYYLRELVATHDDLARDPAVLLELARLTPSPDESLRLIESALSRTRDSVLLSAGAELQGDYLYACGRYAEAAAAYEQASLHAPEERADWMLLKRAASLLALGDASAAVEAYRRLAEGGGVPNEVTPWAALGLGEALLVKGEVDDAATEFERVADGYPSHDVTPRALFGAAQALRAAGDTAGAHAALRTLVNGYPETFEAVLAREDLRTLTSALGALGPDSTSVLPSGQETGDYADELPE